MAREISEHDATLAVDAAAQAVFAASRKAVFDTLPPETAARLADWDGIGPVQQLEWRQQVLPLVWAALGALPDQRHTAWLEGHQAGLDDGNRWYDGIMNQDAVNPYPAEEV